MWNKIKKITQSSNGSARHLVLIRILPSSLVHLFHHPLSLSLSVSFLFCRIFVSCKFFSFFVCSVVIFHPVFSCLIDCFFFLRLTFLCSSSHLPPHRTQANSHESFSLFCFCRVFRFFGYFSIFCILFRVFTIFFHFLYRLSHRLFCCITPAWNIGSPSRRGNLVSSLFRTFPISNGYCVAHIFSISSF